MKRRSAILATLALVGTLATLSGCIFTDDEKLNEVRANATPNLDTMYQRPEDIDNALTVMMDENGRMFWQDLGRAFYVDRPSRLTREPVARP